MSKHDAKYIEKFQKRVPKTDEELKQIAEDLWAGKIFCDRQVQSRRPEDITMVFMVLMFMDKKQLKQLEKDEVDFFYEYMSQATPRGINGMPTFWSVRVLTKPETKRMFEYYEAIKGALANVKLAPDGAISNANKNKKGRKE